MSDNKLVKTIMDVVTLTGLATGWIAKKMVEETLTADPGSNVMNYVKFTAVMAGSVALKQYLEYHSAEDWYGILMVWYTLFKSRRHASPNNT